MQKLGIILGSIRKNRNGQRVMEEVVRASKTFEGFETEVLDLQDWPLPMYDLADGEEKTGIAKRWVDKIGEKDAFLVITPEYNHGYSSVLKNAIDYPKEQWVKKPISFIGYGGAAGGSRAIEQLRQVAVELQMAPVRESLLIGGVWQVFDEEGRMKDQEFDLKVHNVLDQLLWWSQTLSSARNK
jgi:NAD(P)H-dependent FMN reductase